VKVIPVSLVLIIVLAVVALVVALTGAVLVVPRSRRGQAMIGRLIQRSPRLQRFAMRQVESALQKDPDLLSKLPLNDADPMTAQAQQALAGMPPAARQRAMRQAMKAMESGHMPTDLGDFDPKLVEQALASVPKAPGKATAQQRAEAARKRKSQRNARKGNRKR
jgi:hypothetical protein